MNNQECKIRPWIINFNSYAPSFYPYSIKVNKSSGSCNNINDSYARLCVPDVFKNINVKVFNLISRTNEVRHIKWHETCKCRCRLDATVCNKQRWNNGKCSCECKDWLTKEYAIKDLFWILVTVNVNVINHVMLKNIETIKILNVEKSY